jgi:hypothetical protein
MACEANVLVHIEVFVSFEMAMAHAARDSYPVNYFPDMLIVGELDIDVVNIIFRDFFYGMTFRPHTGGIHNTRVGFLADSTDHAVNRLSQSVNFTFDITAKAGL